VFLFCGARIRMQILESSRPRRSLMTSPPVLLQHSQDVGPTLHIVFRVESHGGAELGGIYSRFRVQISFLGKHEWEDSGRAEIGARSGFVRESCVDIRISCPLKMTFCSSRNVARGQFRAEDPVHRAWIIFLADVLAKLLRVVGQEEPCELGISEGAARGSEGAQGKDVSGGKKNVRKAGILAESGWNSSRVSVCSRR